jgi:ankyrin repeat protein
MPARRHDLFFASIRSGQVAMMDALIDAEPELLTDLIDLSHRGGPGDAAGMTALHVAAIAGQVEAARRLIEHGVDMNARNADGRMAVHDAFESGQVAIAQMLFEAGCEVDACAAAAFGRNGDLKKRLPAEANDMTTGLTPLGWAAYGQNEEGARLLIAAGAKVVGDPWDELAWGPACDVCAMGVAKVMLAAGADPNWRGPDGSTPLHMVIASPLVGEPSFFIETLLEAGADRSLKDAAGHTAVDLARAQKTVLAYQPAGGKPTKNLDRTIEVLSR